MEVKLKQVRLPDVNGVSMSKFANRCKVDVRTRASVQDVVQDIDNYVGQAPLMPQVA